MATKTVNFNTDCDLCESHVEIIAKWLSCNGEVWGVGPTLVFASAAALFLFNELSSTVFLTGEQAHVYMLEKTLASTMVVGMLALMVHLWVCSMRFFQYYLDQIIRDSPSMLLELTTAGLLGGKAEAVALGPLTRFLRTQQPQIHMTVCWFLSLCYADYIRKNYCHSFNMPYLEQWQTMLQHRAVRTVNATMQKVSGFVGAVHQRLRTFVPPETTPCQQCARALPSQTTKSVPPKKTSVVVSATCSDIISGGGRASSMLDISPARPISQSDKEINVRLVGKASETIAEAIAKLRNDLKLFEWAKCGEGAISVVPTVLWAAGAGALAQRMLAALFRRFVFRRVPLWELILQHLLFIWMVIYSLYFWIIVVQVIKTIVQYCFDDNALVIPEDDIYSCKIMQQWMIWMCGVTPLAVYIHTRPRPEIPPLMIWITTSPWHRREMGPYGYYLNRPLSSSLQSSTNLTTRHQALTLRRAFSDSKIIIKEPPKKKRYSKSV